MHVKHKYCTIHTIRVRTFLNFLTNCDRPEEFVELVELLLLQLLLVWLRGLITSLFKEYKYMHWKSSNDKKC